MPNDLDAQFWRACDILRRDDNTQSLLDYVEQISWLLFLKSHEDQEDTRADEAEYAGQPYERVIDGFYRWSVWTGGRIEQARSLSLEAQSALRTLQKNLVALESSTKKDPQEIKNAHLALESGEQKVQIASERVETEQQLQRDALKPLIESSDEEDHHMAEQCAVSGSME